MQANSPKHQTASDNLLHIVASDLVSPDGRDGLAVDPMVTHKPVTFHSHSSSTMAMNASPAVVTRYLDNHREWFHRCAAPMQAQIIGENSYNLKIGTFGAFGYDVEPCIGLELLPQEAGIYRIQTVMLPDAQFLGYEVDFQAMLELFEQAYRGQTTTTVSWELDLTVLIQFPGFIHTLPMGLIQTTGDRLINRIVRQVSNRLTRKVQEDFHDSLGLPYPPKSSRRSRKL
ncbi:MAG: DUF1997 domain-containing protein [Elainellaceae cyanobacterium]